MSIEIKPEPDDDPEKPREGPTAAELSKAYTDLTAGLGDAVSAAAMQPVLDQFKDSLGFKGIPSGIFESVGATYEPPNLLDSIPESLRPDRTPPPIDFIDVRSPSVEIAASTDRMAELMQRQHEAIAQLVSLTATNLQHTEAQRESAERTERFTRGMAWGSLAVSIASLAAAIGAIVVSITVGG